MAFNFFHDQKQSIFFLGLRGQRSRFSHLLSQKKFKGFFVEFCFYILKLFCLFVKNVKSFFMIFTSPPLEIKTKEFFNKILL